jgi:Zn-dependent M32 family carboxypeptidase|tara:strand:- start:162 stop:479 length:318 start_codon:yes stop_codon:yes gene_type:complete
MASINDIYKKLVKLESIVKTIKKEEDIIQREEREDVNLSRKEWGVIQKLGKKTKKRYNGLMSWKGNIWENCKNKKEVSRRGEIDYKCKVTKKTCRFLDCPLNIAD